MHENKDWIEPFESALKEINASYQLWYIPEIDIDFNTAPCDAIYYNRMSASSHTRGHRYDPEFTVAILEWLKRHERTVVNGPRALDLEISKLRQYQELEKFNIKTPLTYASTNKDLLIKNAEKIGFPLISKHNRAGKGLGVYKFNSSKELESFYAKEDFESSIDGINLLQAYIQAPEPFITRMEFIGGKFFYAVQVDTSKGFELCPADECQIESNCPTNNVSKFKILKDFSMPNIEVYENFLAANDIGISGIEFILDEQGQPWTYDVNVNTNYNSEAEANAGKFAYKEVIRYLASLQESSRIKSLQKEKVFK
ncbi:MAG: ATP-grasp domain-containing protein [Gammaproteobacteria bacterium]